MQKAPAYLHGVFFECNTSVFPLRSDRVSEAFDALRLVTKAIIGHHCGDDLPYPSIENVEVDTDRDLSDFRCAAP